MIIYKFRILVRKSLSTNLNLPQMLTAAVVSSLSALIGPQFDLGEIRWIHFNFSFLLQSIFSNGLECLFNIQSLLGTCLKVRNVVLALTPLLSSLA